MLCTASPTLPVHPDIKFEPRHSPRGNYEYSRTRHQIRPTLTSSRLALLPGQPQLRKYYPSPPSPHPPRRPSSYSPPSRRRVVNVTTQTNTLGTSLPATSTQIPTPTIAGLKIKGKSESPQSSDETSSSSAESAPAEPLKPAATAPPGSRGRSLSQSHIKRQAENSDSEAGGRSTEHDHDLDDSRTKKTRPPPPAVRIVPQQYELCDTRDLVILISSMLMEVIQYNDAIPLKDGSLTRFHSCALPAISVQDYLQRLATHSTLSPLILLSMVYYIDRLYAIYPAFTITSLTVHRFLIASSTVASKGLSDWFWTNKIYARVRGISIKELALLELELLVRLD